MKSEKVEITTENEKARPCQLTRRRFLQTAGGATAAMIVLPGIGEVQAAHTKFPRKLVGKVSALKADKPVNISFPDKKALAMLVKLGAPAGGGVGPDKDIVAFNINCTHMGTPMLGGYDAKWKGLGPCPSHLTRFDLTRFGIVVSGHATESLPQVLLEVEGDNIYATGVRGLIFGRASNG